jgi:hypothetical protein
MSQRTYSVIAGIIFLLVALLHALRLLFDWHVVVGDFAVPVWVSWLGVVFAGYLGYQGLRLAKRRVE